MPDIKSINFEESPIDDLPNNPELMLHDFSNSLNNLNKQFNEMSKSLTPIIYNSLKNFKFTFPDYDEIFLKNINAVISRNLELQKYAYSELATKLSEKILSNFRTQLNSFLNRPIDVALDLSQPVPDELKDALDSAYSVLDKTLKQESVQPDNKVAETINITYNIYTTSELDKKNLTIADYINILYSLVYIAIPFIQDEQLRNTCLDAISKAFEMFFNFFNQ